MKNRKLSERDFSPYEFLTEYKWSEIQETRAFHLYCRLCKEAGIPRNVRKRGYNISVSKIVPNFCYGSIGYFWSPHAGTGFWIYVNLDWLSKNLTKREFADYVKLRLKHK